MPVGEPTASAIELADCLTAGRDKRKRREPSAVAVFDLGGGTFDASVVWIEDDEFHVLASAGIEHLGGDDFDNILLDMFLERLSQPANAVSPLTRHALRRQARSQKESCQGAVGDQDSSAGRVTAVAVLCPVDRLTASQRLPDDSSLQEL